MQPFYVFIWFCALGAAVVIPLSLRKSRLAFLIWFALYIGTYALLSSRGQYVPAGPPSFRNHWIPLNCAASPNPRRPLKFSLSPVGAFFLPLIWIDRALVHTTKG